MAFKIENNPLFQQEEKPAKKKTAKPAEEVKEAHVQKEKKQRGRPRNDDLVRGNSTQEGLTADYTRATYLMRVELVEKVKDYAYTERLDLKTAINKLVEMALTQEEKRLKKAGAEILKRNGGNN